jgi:DNA-binding NarL/FixJ family response regulator
MSVRVMIVDDQEPFRQAARLVVESTDGFDVIGEADSGEAGVELAREVDPDLVLMDVNMPGINGLEATRQIVDHANHRVVILLLSTYEESEFGPRVVESGASGFISKSTFEPSSLRDAWERTGS